MPAMGTNLKPCDVDKWVPGSQDAAMSCSQAVGAIQTPYFQNFAYNTDQPFSSLCRPNAGLGGGCQSLGSVERAQTWERTLKPQLKEQLAAHQTQSNAVLTTGSMDGAPATALCNVTNSTLDQCISVTEPTCFVSPLNSWMQPNWKSL